MGYRLLTINNNIVIAGRWLVLGCVLLLAGCHSRTESQETDSESVADTQVVAEVDTIPQVVADTAEVVTKKVHVLQHESPEITNLRLFARKQRTIYSPSLMVGEWLRAAEHEEYFADNTGRRWDTSEDIQRDEAQVFTWTLDSNFLTLKYTMAFGAVMVRQYVVTFVDNESLVYRDAFGDSFMWDKVVSE